MAGDQLRELLDTSLTRILRLAPSRRFPQLVQEAKSLQEKIKRGPLPPGPEGGARSGTPLRAHEGRGPL